MSAEMTFQEALDRYLSEISSRLAPESYARQERLARTTAKGIGENQLLTAITPLILDRYREKRLKGASAATVEKDLLFLSELFEVALHQWQLPLGGNPVTSLGTTARSHRRDRRLRQGEQVRLLAACDHQANPLLGWLVRLGLETAMRKSELLILNHEDLDLEGRLATVPKTPARAPRTVPLTQRAVRLFSEVLSYDGRPTDTTLLFFGELGRYESRRPYSVDRIFRHTLQVARMRAFRFGDLRFEAISRFREAGCTEAEIVAIAGTRLIRGRRLPEQQPDALIARFDALGIGLVEEKKAVKETAVEVLVAADDQELTEQEISTREEGGGNTGRGRKRVRRGSFGVPIRRLER